MKNFKGMASLLFAATLAVFITALFQIPFYISVPLIAAATIMPMQKNVLGLNATNNLAARAGFDHARHMFAMAQLDKFNGVYARAKKWADSLKLSQNEIRREVTLTATSQSFSFGITVNQNSQGATGLFNTEVPLQQQDSLCVYEYGIFVRKLTSAVTTDDELKTYGNPQVFSTATVAAALNGTFYSHGQFKITVNNDVVLPARGLFNHKYIPQTQNGVGITAQTIFSQDQVRGAEDGFVTCEPNIVLIGSKNYVPQIILPTNLAAVETFQRAVIIFRGCLAINSTVIV